MIELAAQDKPNEEAIERKKTSGDLQNSTRGERRDLRAKVISMLAPE
jgi:hypothetical protein